MNKFESIPSVPFSEKPKEETEQVSVEQEAGQEQIIQELSDKLNEFHESDVVKDLIEKLEQHGDDEVLVTRQLQKMLLDSGISKLAERVRNELTLGDQYDLVRKLNLTGISEILESNEDPQAYYEANSALKKITPEPKPDTDDTVAYNEYKNQLEQGLKRCYCGEMPGERLQKIVNVLESNDFYKIIDSNSNNLTPDEMKAVGKVDFDEYFGECSSITKSNIRRILGLAMKYDKELVIEGLKTYFGVFEDNAKQRFPHMFQEK